MGHHAAYAQTDIWAFYCEDNGAHVDAVAGGPGSSNVSTCNEPNAGTSSGFKRIPFENNPLLYSTIREQNNLANTPEVEAICFQGAADPDGSGSFSWDFSQINTWDCINNFRADNDLGLGVDDPVLSASQPLELQNTELIVLDLSALVGEYENFMFRLSSNTDGEIGWLATSNKGPSGMVTQTDVTVLNAPTNYPGCSPGIGCSTNDAYVSFNPQNYLYIKQLGDNRDISFQQIKADMIVIGGSGVPIEQSALLISGMKTTGSYMIPILMAAAGFGILIARRF